MTTPNRHKKVFELFLAACTLLPEERSAYLDQACGDDAELHAEVVAMLARDGRQTDFLESPSIREPRGGQPDVPTAETDDGTATHDNRTDGGRPERIGQYAIREVLGEGGMGIVYLAEQDKPRRKVALKVIKPGMDSKAVIARFEVERQALALMDHPNVARVYDAGTTERGLPYFVMEHVAGVPITEHCDRHKLSIDQRLDLFMQVCEAVQHAHQKGVIHRDLKPGNVLVSIPTTAGPGVAGSGADVSGVPKVIDFGVAKAIGAALTEKTLFTERGQLVGTPAYMSPEQAELTSRDIDTHSDIYSLGVLLYELLTGTLPFDPASLREAAHHSRS